MSPVSIAFDVNLSPGGSPFTLTVGRDGDSTLIRTAPCIFSFVLYRSSRLWTKISAPSSSTGMNFA